MKQLQGKDLNVLDIIFIDDRSIGNLVAKAVRYVECGGKYPTNNFAPNHCGVVVETNDNIHEVKIAQAQGNGVSVKPLKLWSKHSKVNIIVKRYNRPFKGKRKKLLNWYLSKVGSKYDFVALVGILGRYLLLKHGKSMLIRWYCKHRRNPFGSKIKFFCSEYIYKGFLEILRVHLWRDYHWTYITPLDLYKSKKLTTIAKHFNYKYK